MPWPTSSSSIYLLTASSGGVDFEDHNARHEIGGADLLTIGSIPSAFTAGSVIFAGATALAENNANFKWDNAGSILVLDGAAGNTQIKFNPATYTGANVALQVIVGAEANPRFYVNQAGTLVWGAGGATLVDTNLYRQGANILRTSDRLESAIITQQLGLLYDATNKCTFTVDASGNILVTPSGGLWAVAGNISLSVIGNGLKIKEGANARMGVATLVGGVVTVANTSVTANTRIFAFHQTLGGTIGVLYVSAVVAATSFTITSSNILDTSIISWLCIEPA